MLPPQGQPISAAPVSPNSPGTPEAANYTPLVRLEDVHVTLQGAQALVNVSLTIQSGEHMALLGPNGAGKSTLLKILRGEIRPDQRHGGTVHWFPQGCGPEGDDAPLAGRGMTALLSPSLQEHYMRQGWNIRGDELVIAGLYDDYLLYNEPTEAQRARCADLAAELRAESLLDRPVATLSQGQLRVLLLMRALIRRPRLLLLDEAADGLDAPTRCMFLLLLESLTQQPAAPTLVFTTHRSRLPGFLKLTAHMENGRLTGPAPLPDGDPAESRCTLFPIPALSRAVEESASPHSTAQQSPVFPPSPAGAHITFRNATVFVDRAEVLHNIDWIIRPGEQWTVLGGNGAGKSTLLRVIIGEEPVAVGGDLCRRLPRHGGDNPDLSHIQRGIKLVSDRLQALYTYDDTVEEVVFSGLDGSVGVYREAEAVERTEILRCLKLVGMEAFAERPFRQLSTGQARRVLLARALTGDPEILLLDEPFSGLDAENRAAMTAILEARIAEGLQTVLVSHHDEDILPSCTHLARLENGRLTATFVAG